ncbi:hypothetical protein ZWY2020_053878 [Hordeum vulgare]|nr:hypothetical protein ZWY2020_051008 [Hordeum vulgare]KAI4998536.1 hypothetical protein ZWY2020_053878 [Hordeum vulgare]
MEAVAWATRRSIQEAAASYVHQAAAARSTARSVETIVVIIAAIVLAAALAGACGGRHVAPGADAEGWVERRCRSCLDSGLPPATSASKASEAK